MYYKPNCKKLEEGSWPSQWMTFNLRLSGFYTSYSRPNDRPLELRSTPLLLAISQIASENLSGLYWNLLSVERPKSLLKRASVSPVLSGLYTMMFRILLLLMVPKANRYLKNES